MVDDVRENHRVRAQVPLRLKSDQAKGVTVNMSATGVYFVTDAALSAGQPVRFSIQFENNTDPSGILFLECEGNVTRVEHAGEKFGVGIRILESRLERRDRRVQNIPEARAGQPERRRPWQPAAPPERAETTY